MSLSLGRSLGMDGLPADFYRTFWTIIGPDYFEVVKKCIYRRVLPKSSQRAVLALLPKKGDLAVLKNWRPVAILCTDYKILSKCLANRLNKVLCEIIHKDQSYCIKDRSITDNLHLMRDITDYALFNDINVGVLSLDQEKAFDRVDHTYLFKTLQAFGFGKTFISMIKVLYTDATCMIGMAGGLSTPIKVLRGIRQGCPLSGQLYSMAIEPFLCKLRNGLTGLQVNTVASQHSIKLTAYADDVTVIIRNREDVNFLKESLESFKKAASAKINWGKSNTLWCSTNDVGPLLPAGLQWGKNGFKYLGVFLGIEEYRNQNWLGLVEKVCARLSQWQWLLPQLSYRGRVLICNNLVASSLWHKMTILEPPHDLVQTIQRHLIDFFWSGQHWLRAPVLFLPREEGGQGLVDIKSRAKINVKSVRLVQNLLNKVKDSLPHDFIPSVERPEEGTVVAFPGLKISATGGTWQEAKGSLFTFRIPQLGFFCDTNKKTLYTICVKVSHLKALESLKDSKWQEVLGLDASPKGSWRTLYKPPIDKRSGDLQWRVVHGIIATNRHRAHLDPNINQECPFCGQQETFFHLFLNCERLIPLFSTLEEWSHRLGQALTE